MSTAPTTTSIATPAPFADVIEAARASVQIEGRLVDFRVADDNGDSHAIPVRLTTSGGGQSRIEVAVDVVQEAERRAAGPRRRAGTVELGALVDFIAYVNRYKTPDVVVFAPLSPPGVTAIFDYHAPAQETSLPPASWCQDRATYKCPLSRQWQTWVGCEGKAFTQTGFGDFIEANQLDLATKDGFASATKMLEVARNLVINTGSKFQRTVDPTTGTGTLIVKDEHDEATSTKIPKSFALAVPVFEGDDTAYLVEALVRFTMVEGRPSFTFVLQNKEKVLEDALKTLRTQVATGTGAPVFVGTPPAAAR